jgi:DNA-directed RNA polymerase specialized sigma24 family protein
MAARMSSSPEVAPRGSGNPTPPPLTDAQLAAFWQGIIAHGDAARRTAGQVVRPQDVEDVVSTASILFVESLQRAEKPAPFPESDDQFRARFLTIVRNHALDLVRDSDASERPVHSHWGVDHEPALRGRKTADRPLDHVFARNDRDKYDAPASAQARDQDDVGKLEEILRVRIAALTRMQRIVIEETFLEKRKRAEVARRHNISVKTYDNHVQAAFHAMRDELWCDAWNEWDDDRSSWYDRIEQLSDRYDAALGRRLAKREEELRAFVEEDKRYREERDRKSGAGAA